MLRYSVLEILLAFLQSHLKKFFLTLYLMDEVGGSFIFSIISFLMFVQKIKVIEKQILVTLIPILLFCHYIKRFPNEILVNCFISRFLESVILLFGEVFLFYIQI